MEVKKNFKNLELKNNQLRLKGDTYEIWNYILLGNNKKLTNDEIKNEILKNCQFSQDDNENESIINDIISSDEWCKQINDVIILLQESTSGELLFTNQQIEELDKHLS